jgi:hypothetical protein
MLKVKEIYLLGRDNCTKSGNSTRFWQDWWVYQQPLCTVAPELFELCECKEVTVNKVRSGEVQITFRRWLPDNLRTSWDQIWCDVISFRLENELDRIVWSLEKNRRFSVKSVYNSLTSLDEGSYHKLIWEGKVPAKIKIFMWLMINNAILTKDNLLNRKWKGNPECYFCSCPESIPHLFFQCSVAKSVWTVIAMCFGAKESRSMLEMVREMVTIR